jgi:chemotaxis protein MotB
MADEQSNHPVIIVKKKKHGEHGHHGGAWKVAYADFVTAMMAFFLLLWLLNVTTEEQKQGIAQYFTPESVSRANSGSGQILGGTVIAQGQMARVTGGVVMGIPQDPSQEDPEEPVDDPKEESKEEKNAGKSEAEKNPASENARKEATEDDIKKALAKREEEEFAKAEHDLRQAIQDVPELRQLAQNLIIDRTPEGMRIQIVDQDGVAMFPLGSAAPHEHTRKLLAMVAKVVQKMPNKIAVTGHTDATPYAQGSRAYDNWELSTDRANSSRRGLLEAGVRIQRISRVVGKADQEPLFADNPADPRNRRISIVLLREAPSTTAH